MHRLIKSAAGLFCLWLVFFLAGCDDNKSGSREKKEPVRQRIPVEAKAVEQKQPAQKIPADQQAPDTMKKEEKAPAADTDVEKTDGQATAGTSETGAKQDIEALPVVDETAELPADEAPETTPDSTSDYQEEVGEDEASQVAATMDVEAEPSDIEKIVEMSESIQIGFEEAGEPAAPASESETEEETEDYNPFAPLFQEEEQSVVAQEQGGSDRKRAFLTPLERISLGQLELKGIIRATSGNRAIVTDASGKGYVIKKGTYIGLNSGRVEEIVDEKVIVVEMVGGRKAKTELKLQKDTGE
ncbi:MAG: pilus assembly protein PilP [Thermodesulfobacteriota bacterium]|nr:pilus assembly protein PilP [Thermodesulfobacteriota bacterium]